MKGVFVDCVLAAAPLPSPALFSEVSGKLFLIEGSRSRGGVEALELGLRVVRCLSNVWDECLCISFLSSLASAYADVRTKLLVAEGDE